MKIPKRLIPKSFYKFIEFSDNNKNNYLFILRSINNDVLDSADRVRPSSVFNIDSKIFPINLSMNILSRFKVADLIYNCGIDDWNECEKCSCRKPKKIYEQSDFTPIALHLKDVMNNKDFSFEVLKPGTQKKTPTMHNGTMSIDHKPLKKNFGILSGILLIKIQINF